MGFYGEKMGESTCDYVDTSAHNYDFFGDYLCYENDQELCVLGECRGHCQGDFECAENEFCLESLGYCIDTFYGLFTWMQDKGYEPDFIDTYIDGMKDEMGFAYLAWYDILMKLNFNNPNQRMRAFKSEETMKVNINYIKDPDSILDYPIWDHMAIEDFQNNLNIAYGRDPNNPFFIVTRNIIEEEYEDIFSCELCEITEMAYTPSAPPYIEPGYWSLPYFKPDGTQASTGYVYFVDSIKYFSGPGTTLYTNGEEYFYGDLDEYNHPVCKSEDLNIDIYISVLDESTVLSPLARPNGQDGCNVVLRDPSYTFDARYFHEIGHTLGITHPYVLDYTGGSDDYTYFLLPESLMIQNPYRNRLGLVSKFSPIEYHSMEPLGGYENFEAVVKDYNANAVYRDYVLLNSEEL